MISEHVITGRTTVVGVIGQPIAHSLSPIMQNAAFAAMGLDWVYVPFPVAPACVAEAIRGLEALGVRGINVTIPHKQTVIPLLDRLTPEADAVGSVNTIAFTPEGRYGHSTDGVGFLRGLTAGGHPVAGTRAVVLGAGGAARAVVGALAGAGATSVTVLARTPAKGQDLPALAERLAPGAIRATVQSWPEDARPLLAAADLLVNATSVGMAAHGADQLPVAADALHPGLTVYDLVYTPRRTALLAAAAARGCRTVDGVAMLVHQGAEAIRFWSGNPAPADVMEAALAEYLPAG